MYNLQQVQLAASLTLTHLDGVPIIYHNWRVQTQSLKNKPVFTPIGDLTLDQFKSLDVRHQNGYLK